MDKTIVNRRNLLKSLGWSAIGITVFTTGCSQLNPLPPLPHRSDPTSEDAAVWISLRPDGKVEIISPRAELGQGISTAIKQIVAEEMHVDINQIHYLNPRSDRMPSVKATVGSDSVMSFGPLIASAAAALAEELDMRARVVYGLKTGKYTLKEDQLVSLSGESFAVAALLSPALFIDADKIEAAQPRSFSPDMAKRWVGKSCPPHDIEPIVTGSKAVFVDDLSLPDMLFARLVTPPYIKATLAEISDTHAQNIPGYQGLVMDGDLVAIVADRRAVLDRVMDSLQVQWTHTEINQQQIDAAISIETALSAGSLEHDQSDGDINGSVSFDMDITLKVPMASHCAMEPRTAIARYDEASNIKLEIWTATQDVTLTHKNLARDLGLSTEDVVVHSMRVGGGFGGKVFSSIERDAAILSKKMGRSIKLQWMREDEFIRGYHRPPSQHKIRARLNEDGMIDAWWHAFTSGHVIFSSAFLAPWMQGITSFVADKGVKRGALPPYEIANKRIEFEDVRIPVHTGPWRGLGATPNCWAIETAIDELARTGNIDPLDFRLRHLQNSQPRLRNVLQVVADLSNWRERQVTETRAYGLACGIYKDTSYSSTVAEVIRDDDGIFSVTRLWSVHDCGFVVNPDMVEAQIEGNLMWGIGMVFNEQLHVEDSSLSAANFDSYNWASFKSAPQMMIKLIGQDAPPTGAGETAIVSAAASITNGVSTIIRKPVLNLPIQV